jgi:hypothetical protein
VVIQNIGKMAANKYLILPGGLKMPALGFGTFDVSFKHTKEMTFMLFFNFQFLKLFTIFLFT